MKKMIQNFNAMLFLTLVGAVLFACGGKKEATSEKTGDDMTWAGMDAYHMVMAESYHPLRDSSNLAPAKANAEALAAEAESWASAPLPERVNNDEMTTRLENLKASSRAFADKVKAGASDEELSAALSALHEEFHHVHEAWEGGHGEGHKEHH
jgi:hypothetical protein